MLVDSDMVGKNIQCIECGELIDVAIEWHGMVDVEDQRKAGGLRLCRRCAQHLMRILLEDIIAYDNGIHVSLQNVIYHGQKEKHNPWDEKSNLRYSRFTPKKPL